MRRKRLGDELRQIRTEADVSVEQVAELLDCAPSRIRHIENGRNAPRKPELQVLLDRFGASNEVHEVLEGLRKEGAQRGWWATYRLPSWLQAYVGMEMDATDIRVFELELIPGLLQTKAYARRTHELASHMADAEAVDRLADARIRRQSKITGQDPAEFTAVLSESAIRRASLDPTIGPEQLAHLVKVAQLPNVHLHVLPVSTGLHASMSGSFMLLGFPEDVSAPVAYQEYAVGGHLIDEQSVVGNLALVFETLIAETLAENDTVSLIKSVADEM